MGSGLRGIKFAISKQTLSDLIVGKELVDLDMRLLTSADAGKDETFRLLPFSDDAEEIDGYLKYDQLWFVTPRKLNSPVLLWVPKELSKKDQNEVHQNERLISITGVIPNLGPTDVDKLSLQTTIDALLSLGARRLSN